MENAVVLFMTGLVVLFFLSACNSGVPKSAFWEQGEFWSTWLPSWLQAVGTIAAVWIAYRAFENWRTEEVARDQASSAKAMMPTVHRMMVSTRRLRNPRGTVHDPVRASSVRRAGGNMGTPRVREVDALAQGLRAEVEILGTEGLGLDLSEAMESLCKKCTDVATAAFLLGLLREDVQGDREEVQSPSWQKEAAKNLLVLGYRYRGDDGEFINEDVRGRELEAAYVQVMKGLRERRGFR